MSRGLLMLTLIGVDNPEGKARALKVGRQPQRFLEECSLGRRVLGEHALYILLECGQRRVTPLHLLRGDRGIRHKTARDTCIHGKEVVQRTALDNLREHAAGVEADGAGANGQRVSLDLVGADNHLRGTDNLTHADDRGVAQGGNGRHSQLFEGVKAIVAGKGAGAERHEIVREDDR
jgi:hypothetical protein